MAKKRLPSHQKLLELFQTHSLAQLAEMFQVQEATVARKIAQAKRLHISPNPARETRRQLILQLLKEGKNYSQIARMLNLKPTTIRSFAINHGIYKPPTKQYTFARPIGCRLCIIQPYARGLCSQCYNRFVERRYKKLVDYPDKLLILDHPQFQVFYQHPLGYTIHTQFFNGVHIRRPNTLESILLDQLQRQRLIDLDDAAIEAEYNLPPDQEENANPT